MTRCSYGVKNASGGGFVHVCLSPALEQLLLLPPEAGHPPLHLPLLPGVVRQGGVVDPVRVEAAEDAVAGGDEGGHFGGEGEVGDYGGLGGEAVEVPEATVYEADGKPVVVAVKDEAGRREERERGGVRVWGGVSR